MNENKSNNFKSYLEPEEYELEKFNNVHPKLLPGELVITENRNVMLFNPMNLEKSYFGVLYITNFKLSFIRVDVQSNESCSSQQNLLLGEYDVCLSAIDCVYQIIDKRRRLYPGNSVSGKIKGLQIICKNMRVLNFNFQHSSVDSGKSTANTILHHAFPKKHNLLFAYEYIDGYYNSGSYIRFSHVRDWKKEMERTHCQNWKISNGNQTFYNSYSLPQIVVVPSSVTDGQLSKAAEHFQKTFHPVWTWSASNGAALIRMADLVPTILDNTQENIMLEHMRLSHPNRITPSIMDLFKECPTPKDVQSSYLRLRDICTPENIRQFWIQDSKFYSSLENCRWLTYVSQSLAKSLEAANQLNKGITVVLQEGSGQDMCCVISSITQLILDPYWRTIYGFQSLIQKEWVILGHPFTKRLSNVINDDSEHSPLFLLFLDCVWQLLQQFPTAFEFTETYLTTVWDSAHITVFDTFLFNCEHNRYIAETDTQRKLILRSVWDWGEQFPDKEKELFYNPLFDESTKIQLNPDYRIFSLEIWSQCYFRWIPLLEISKGGKPQIDLQNRITRMEIISYNRLLHNGESIGDFTTQKMEINELSQRINSFYPFSNNSSVNTSLQGVLTLNSTLLSEDDVLDSQSILFVPD